eukprot:GHVU01229635.1.p1 GENE.GHVU01229635.1~~GHVU01229635.1.p1  ORF type:complete len:105 (+),score=10.98 GHVU01229635.1:795-1109(+)
MSTTAIALFVATGSFKVHFRGINDQSFDLEMTDSDSPLDELKNKAPQLLTSIGQPHLPCYFYMATNPGLTLIDSKTPWQVNKSSNDATILFIPANGKEITCKDE